MRQKLGLMLIQLHLHDNTFSGANEVIIRVDNELMNVTGVSSNTLTVTRDIGEQPQPHTMIMLL